MKKSMGNNGNKLQLDNILEFHPHIIFDTSALIAFVQRKGSGTSEKGQIGFIRFLKDYVNKYGIYITSNVKKEYLNDEWCNFAKDFGENRLLNDRKSLVKLFEKNGKVLHFPEDISSFQLEYANIIRYIGCAVDASETDIELFFMVFIYQELWGVLQ